MTSVYAQRDVMDLWQRTLHEKGWGAPGWPVEFGGCDWTPVQHLIFAQERARAWAPPFLSLSVIMCGAVIIAFGTPWQKARFLPPMLSGEEYWCQGYSEPGSGSDLASLAMRAEQDGDDLVCNGSKIWTSHAHEADWMYCLVRNDARAKRQQGITFALVDMRSPGIEVRPIVFLTGEHIQNEVVFRNVRVPKANVVGAVGSGWTVAKYLMEFERGGQLRAPEYEMRLDQICAFAAVRDDGNGKPLIRDSAFALRVASARADLQALLALELRSLEAATDGRSPGLSSSLLKIFGTELSQRLTELALEACAYDAWPYRPERTTPGGNTPWAILRAGTSAEFSTEATATLRYFNDRAGSIYAGSNEIQRNILARHALGL